MLMFEAPVSIAIGAEILRVLKSSFCSTPERLVRLPLRFRSLPPSTKLPALAAKVRPVALNSGKSLFGARLTVPSKVKLDESDGVMSPTQLLPLLQNGLA